MKLSQKSKSELAVAFCFMIPALIALHEINTKFVEKGMHTGGGEQNAALFSQAPFVASPGAGHHKDCRSFYRLIQIQ